MMQLSGESSARRIRSAGRRYFRDGRFDCRGATIRRSLALEDFDIVFTRYQRTPNFNATMKALDGGYGHLAK
jgi:hypothetical protein